MNSVTRSRTSLPAPRRRMMVHAEEDEARTTSSAEEYEIGESCDEEHDKPAGAM